MLWYGKKVLIVRTVFLGVTGTSPTEQFSHSSCYPCVPDERRRMRDALDCWEVYLEMRQTKRRMLESALQFERLASLR